MKHFSLFFSIVFLLLSCSDDDGILDSYWGNVNAEANGVFWSANPQGTSNVYSAEYFNLGFDVYNAQNFHRELLWIRNIPKSIGVYEVSPLVYDSVETIGSFYLTSTSDGDVGCDHYDLFETAESSNILEITRFENNGALIEGTFNLTFLIDDPTPSNKCDPNAPDKLRFTNGTFKTKIMR